MIRERRKFALNKRSGVVVVTGAARGIARDFCLVFSLYSNHFILLDVSGYDSMSELKEDLNRRGSTAEIVLADASKFSELKQALTPALIKFETVDYLFAFAGVSPLPNDHLSHNQREFLMQNNYYSVDNMIAFFSIGEKLDGKPLLRNLVAITSISKLVTTQNSGYYSASKSALSAYLQGLRLKHLKDNFSVKEIVCGFVDTRVNEGVKHAEFVMVSSKKAAEKIYRVLKRRRSVHSIPFFRNIPWYLLRVIPTSLRNRILHHLFLCLYGKDSNF